MKYVNNSRCINYDIHNKLWYSYICNLTLMKPTYYKEVNLFELSLCIMYHSNINDRFYYIPYESESILISPHYKISYMFNYMINIRNMITNRIYEY